MCIDSSHSSKQVYLITGAASGIGRAIALQMARSGASIVAADIDQHGLAAIAQELRLAGAAGVSEVSGDQTDGDVVEESVAAAWTSFGRLDGVVINVGTAVTGDLDTVALAKWQHAFRVNVESAFLLTAASLRTMRQHQTGGSLVYIGSKSALGPTAGFGPYSASKAAVLQLMRVAAIEGAPYGIRANAVNPGAVFGASRLWNGGVREERARSFAVAAEDLETFYASRTLLGQSVTTEDVAESAAFLLSDASRSITGGILNVDAGLPVAFPR
jgi:NAD(P)-dependent dehydrogenase (short-subunit alcohol dehydrogenase family)